MPSGRGGQGEGLRGRGQVEGDGAGQAQGDHPVSGAVSGGSAGHWQKSSGHCLSCHWRDRPAGATMWPMQISILAFPGLTALDAVGPYEVLRSVPGWEVAFVGKERGEVRTDVGSLGLTVDHDFAERPEADILLVPGGEGNRALLDDEEVLDWVRGVDAGSRWTTSVCTGSLVLGAAGLLAGQEGDRPLAPPRAAARVRRRPGRRPLGRGRQVPHRGGRLGRDRHGAPPGRPRERPASSPRRSSWRSSTTPSRPTTPGPRTRPRRRWSTPSAPTKSADLRPAVPYGPQGAKRTARRGWVRREPPRPPSARRLWRRRG